ncbi:MAG: carboxymuconolactone decarboxylase family protein [Actinomycetota bacterium]|nr:carboxymuconolactone decarboxylase family protein [Actinomycetota bacterium]
MARIPYVDPDAAPESVREALSALPDLNIFRLLAHAETAFRPALRVGGAILGAQRLDPALRELAILHVAQATGAEYEWVQHVPIARTAGVRDEQVVAVQRGELAAACFNRRECLVLRCAAEALRDDRASPEAFDALVSELSAREAIELLLAVGYYRTLATIMRSAEIDLDEPAGTAVVESARPPAD